jgi:Spy/CpxP family protein refolding chaperone
MKTLCAALLVWSAVARAEPPKGPDPIAARLYPPELIMGHQQEIGLDAKQRDALVGEVQKVQAQVLPLQFQMQALSEQLVTQLDAARVDEGKALALVDKMMGLERDIKRAHFGLLIRIRNLLSDGQRSRLAALRRDTP